MRISRQEKLVVDTGYSLFEIMNPSRALKIMYDLILHAPKSVTDEKKITLIKMVREVGMIGLKESKTVVEAALKTYENDNIALQTCNYMFVKDETSTEYRINEPNEALKTLYKVLDEALTYVYVQHKDDLVRLVQHTQSMPDVIAIAFVEDAMG